MLSVSRATSFTVLWSLVSQILSVASNGLVILAVAGVSLENEFGYFSVAYTFLALMLALERNFLAANVSLAAGDTRAIDTETNKASTLLLVVSPAMVVVLLAGSTVSGGIPSASIVALIAFIPVVLVQDLLRHSAVAHERASIAAQADGLWFGAAVGALTWRFIGDPSALQMVCSWGLGALVATAWLALDLRPHIATTGMISWLKESISTRAHLSIAALAGAGSVAVSAVIVVRIAGPQASAAIAGAGQLMAPVAIATATIPLVLLPQSIALGNRRKVQMLALSASIVFVLALVWSLAVSSLPEQLGSALLGDTWYSAQPLLIVAGVGAALVAVGVAGGVLCTSLDLTAIVMTTRIIQGVLRIVVTVVIAIVFGSAFGLLVAEGIVVGLFAGVLWLSPILALHRGHRK